MPSMSRKGSPSMIMRSANVPLSPSSALQTTYLLLGPRVVHGLPLDPGREAGAAAPAQTGEPDLLDDFFAATSSQRRPQALKPTVRAIVVKR